MKSKISVLLVVLTAACFSQPGFNIVSSDKSSFIFEYSPSFNESSFVMINNEKFIIPVISGGYFDNAKWGMPSIPGFSIPLGVPTETGNTIQVIQSSYKEIRGKIAPVPGFKSVNGINTEVYSVGPDYYSFNSLESDLVKFGEYGLVRNIPVQNIIVSPVQYNSSEEKIRIYQKIVIKVTFAASNPYGSKIYDKFLEDVIPNYKTAFQWNTEADRLKKGVFNSVLANGKWFRFEAPEEGMFKITKDMLPAYGIDINIDPRTIKIYNNGGIMLPEKQSTPVPLDLVENAIFVSGEADGRFDDNDYILFYGRGSHFWDYDTTAKKIARMFHLYSKENYFWITSGGAQGKRISGKDGLPGSGEIIRNTTPAFVAWDEDKINLGKSGRYSVGDEFAENMRSRTYTNKLDQIVQNSKINYTFSFLNSDENYIQLKIDDNANQIFSASIPGRKVEAWYDFSVGYQTLGFGTFTGSLPEDRSVLKFTFNASGDKSKGYLNYFEIYFTKNLIPTADLLTFFSPDTSATVEYQLSGFSNSNINVFDVSDYSNVKLVNNPILVSGGEYRFISAETRFRVSKYIAIGNNNYKSPINPVEISNSNIHGESTGGKLIIVTHKDFYDHAVRLKTYRENTSAIKVLTYVVDIDNIFNEFSGGVRDISGLRNFIKYAFENWEVKPENLLILGDASYDFKNIEGQGGNYVLTYQTPLSFHLLDSYPTDDFFVKISGDDDKVDMGVGRLTVNSLSEARDAIDKSIFYETQSVRGDWQNTITLVADDNLTSAGFEGNYHTPQSEELASTRIPGHFNLNKIYLGAYPTVITGFGRTKPGVTEDIINSVNKGTLILNYIGHGSPEVWAHERVFETSSTIPQFRNDKYFFMTAATCDFGYFDIPGVPSGAEILTIKPNSGAIGVFTASRPVFSHENAELNKEFYLNLLNLPKDTLSYTNTLGKVYFRTKIVRGSINDNKYHLFGDPSVRLLIPRYLSAIDSVNGIELLTSPYPIISPISPGDNIRVDSDPSISGSRKDRPIQLNQVQIKALGTSRISGHVIKDSTVWTDFNGEGILTVFDSQRRVYLPQLDYTVTMEGGVIFRGRLSVRNGYFTSTFVVPKDISYENNKGKIVFYFSNPENDGIGFTDQIIVGGTDSTAVNDNKGPEIEVFFDDPSFRNASLVNKDSKLIVHLSDQTGLNTTGTGIGHKLEGIMNDKINDPIDFTNYFTGDLDAGGKSGEIKYQFNNLEEGSQKLQLKAWDIFNNFSTETVYFDVVSGNDLEIREVLNYPNPFSSSTTFTLQHNLNQVFDVNIKVFTVSGRLIRDIRKPAVFDRFIKVDWDGRDEDGDLIANGTYFYKVILRSPDGAFSKSIIGKLAVIR